jgi:hypothetical protein
MKNIKQQEKNRTLKKYKKAQTRRFNNKTKLHRTMKGGASSTILVSAYIRYREIQYTDTLEILDYLQRTSNLQRAGGLTRLIEKLQLLKVLLEKHTIKTQQSPNSELWKEEEHRLYSFINTINNLLRAKKYKHRISQPFLEKTEVVDDTEPAITDSSRESASKAKTKEEVSRSGSKSRSGNSNKSQKKDAVSRSRSRNKIRGKRKQKRSTNKRLHA